jgi:predicted AlkP superfamily phosphohydrolase/phosphomutase
MKRPKFLIIGIDGADPDLFQAWKQDLPNLGRLADQRAFGPLRSSEPPLTVPAWYVFATGKQPGNLGVFGFAHRIPGSYSLTFANLASCSSKTMWDLLGEAGLRVGVFNVPGTYPPQPVNGFLVCSSISAPPNDGQLVFTHPSNLSRDLERLVGGYELASMKPVERNNENVMIAERQRVHRKHADALFYLASHEAWDVLIAVFDIADRTGHQMWKHFDPTHPQHELERSPTYADAIKHAYMAVDEEVGRLVALAGEDAMVMVMSDHGFGPQHRTFHLNEWFRQSGYLFVRREDTSSYRNLVRQVSRFLVRMNEQSRWFRQMTKPLRGSTLARRVRSEQAWLESSIPLPSVSVDWSRTVAYSFNHHAIRINLKGREPQGVVEPGEHYEAVVGEIMARLRELRDPEAGRPAVSRVLRREEVYQGAYLLEAPDILVFMEEICSPVVPGFSADGVFDLAPLGTGHHRPYGLLIVSGPGIRSCSIASAELADLLPTVLHILNLPIPDDLDGRLLTEIFEPESIYASREPRFVCVEAKTSPDFAYTEAEERAISDHLEGLGYF